jgi:hypothetical protein
LPGHLETWVPSSAIPHPRAFETSFLVFKLDHLVQLVSFDASPS